MKNTINTDIYTCKYLTPPQFDDVILFSDGTALTGLIFENSFDCKKFSVAERKDLPVFDKAKRWLDEYFSGKNPPVDFPVKSFASSPFRARVYRLLSEIPYGKIVTYGDIARTLAEQSGGKMSAQAVGGAVGSNRLCIIIPCHRVVGANGAMVGFGGGINNKIALLNLEKTATK